MNIDIFMEKLGQCYKQWDSPVITLIAKRKSDPFLILVSTIISLRTKDEVTIKASQRLYEKIKTPRDAVQSGHEAIAKMIYPAGFYPTKAKRIVEISRILLEKYDGKVPSNMDDLLALPGVGRKTANLVLIEAFGKAAICVDTHVHRISNRTGYVKTDSPDATEMALRKKLPLKYWKMYNEILVAFGQKLCRPVSPWCSKCPVSEMCRKKGVIKSR